MWDQSMGNVWPSTSVNPGPPSLGVVPIAELISQLDSDEHRVNVLRLKAFDIDLNCRKHPPVY